MSEAPQSDGTESWQGSVEANCWDSPLIFDVATQRIDDEEIVWLHNAAVRHPIQNHLGMWPPTSGKSFPNGLHVLPQTKSVIHWELPNGQLPMLSLMSYPLFERGQAAQPESRSGIGHFWLSWFPSSLSS
jgi:hypothetical protein